MRKKQKKRRKRTKMSNIKVASIIKAYNIVVNDEDNSAEINMYGEVVKTRPVDFWTGKPISGNFIMQDEFLNDLDELSGKDKITVHINSVGGDLYVGLAIYNRLKGLAAEVITVNDGLAASAGSLIFQAGNTRKMNAGSNLMIHGAAGFLYGYYQVQDLKATIKQLDAHNKAGINAYVEATGRDAASIKTLVDRETWMTGADAVTEGFADEVIGDEANPVDMKMSPNRATMMVNGYPVAARCLGKIPENIPVMTEDEWDEMSTQTDGGNPVTDSMQPAQPIDINTHPNGGTGEMAEIKNLEELRAAYPELMASAENAAQEVGCNAERERIRGIEAIEGAIGDKALVNSAKYGDKPLTAEQLAFEAMKAQASIGANMLNQMNADNAASGAENVTATPATDVDPEANADDEALNVLIGAVNRMKEGK